MRSLYLKYILDILEVNTSTTWASTTWLKLNTTYVVIDWLHDICADIEPVRTEGEDQKWFQCINRIDSSTTDM